MVSTLYRCADVSLLCRFPPPAAELLQEPPNQAPATPTPDLSSSTEVTATALAQLRDISTYTS